MTVSPADYKKLTTGTYDRIAAEIGRGFDSFFETVPPLGTFTFIRLDG